MGGGLTGLVAATYLQAEGLKVKVLDKGRGIGGRFATRRMHHPEGGEARFDYGVQFLTAKSETFQQWLDQLQKEGIVTVHTDQSQQQLHYSGVNGIRNITRHLASSLDTCSATQVVNLKYELGKWMVHTDDGSRYESHFLILTPPVPQSLKLLKTSNFPNFDSAFGILNHVSYRPCLAVLLLLSQPISLLPSDYDVQGEKLDAIICNSQKGISPDAYAVTLQGSATFSEYYDKIEQRETGAQELIAAANDYLDAASIIDYQVHFWRYSTPLTQFDAPFFSPSVFGERAGSRLYLAGDAFSSGDPLIASAENAFLSGLAVAESIGTQRAW